MTTEFEEWIRSNVRKALIVQGERQIGKTFIIRQFIRTHFEYVVELNFYSNPKDREIFKEGRGASDIVSTICLRFPEFKVVKGKSVLFLDELQECPEAITAIKFLVEGTDVEIVASGSMLGVAYKSPRSYPVGSYHT